MEEFDDIIVEQWRAWEFLEWMYAAIPQILMPDAIIAFINIVVLHKRANLSGQNVHQLFGMSTDLNFLSAIYSNTHLKVFKFKQYVAELQTRTLDDDTNVPNFMKVLTLTVMLVL
jgi:hypothetical protein